MAKLIEVISKSQSKRQFVELKSQSHYKCRVKIVEPKLFYYLETDSMITLLELKSYATNTLQIQ